MLPLQILQTLDEGHYYNSSEVMDQVQSTLCGKNRRQETVRACAAAPTENSRHTGSLPLCKKCTLHHTGSCTVKCQTCNKVGHLTRNCKNKGPATRSNLQPVSVTCHACGEKGHYRNQCPKANNNAHGRAYLLRDKIAHQDPNVVTGMFLLNHHLARVLFDLGTDKSFLSISLASKLSIPPITLNTTYDIEMADGNLIGAAPVARAPYRLAPSEIQELSDQLQELADRGYHQLRVRDEDIPKTAFRTRHVIHSQEIHVDPAKIEAVKNWASPTIPTEHILDQKELNMRQCRWLELLADYDCDIRYHPGKANVVAAALSQKE
ncbi:reverse transcriptase domain-containing protein [Tanacetum coccineum]|uniref:Reverse transcriptase domain-containing protein n=1 Tax=Tanacetum coccineum TaxID=301880 RepID=A0ABQ4XFS2_9ASTR